MTGLHPVVGHEEVRLALGRAAAADELPGSLLLHGPAGIGRQRLGLWLGQLLLCERPAAEPCGACQPCRLALRLEHPDLHWFFPLPRPKGASGPEKLADALEEARAAELAARRAEPLRVGGVGELAGLFLAQVQTIRRLAAARPVMGRRRIFLVGDAELLVPQESSQEAANAMLKLLEEPPPDATIMLTAEDPTAILPTLRSRMLPVRLRPLEESVVARFLVDARGVAPPAAAVAARLAEGSIGRALAFLPAGKEPGPLEEVRQKAWALLETTLAPSPLPRLTAAHALPPTGARGGFADLLGFLVLWLRDLAATAAGADSHVINGDSLDRLQVLAARLPHQGAGVPDALRHVDRARGLGRMNVNPQLTLAALLRDVHAELFAAR
jgi:DNA polymerase III subunit delta'